MNEQRNRRLARQRLIVQLALCVILPPIGMILVWRSRYPRRGKLVLSVLSSLVLTLMISFGLSLRPPQDIEPTPMSAEYATAEETLAPAAPAETIAPANPFG